MILPALLLTLDKYSSWRVGRVVPMIRSAVRTTLRSLLWSDLVAELNQTVIDVQRTDSVFRVELFQQLLWQVELPQLAKEIYTHNNMRRCNRLHISYVSWMCIRTTIFFVFVQCVRVVQLNRVKVKVQFMAYRKVGDVL